MDLKNMTNDKKIELTGDPNTPVDVLRELAKDDNWVVRAAVGANPRTSSTLLVIILEYEKTLPHPHNYLIKTLYQNTKLPYVALKIIETLYGDMI